MVMARDHTTLGLDNIEEKVVTKRPPTEGEIRAMRFGWRVVKHVKSNAIVFSSTDRTLGIGAGQMSRVDSSRIAVWKAEEAGLSLEGSIIASDALFPFADGLLARAGVRTGDLVTAIDGVEIETFAAGEKAFYGKRPGPTRLTVLRNGRPLRIEVDLRLVTAGKERSGATLQPGLR